MLLQFSLLFLALLWKDIHCFGFTHPSKLVNEDSYVVLGLTLIELDSTPQGHKKTLSQNLKRMVHSLLYYSPDTNLHFVIISDKSSLTG